MRDYPNIRLFVEHPLQAGATIPLEEKQAHYLTNVMRLAGGSILGVFNGQDGEWRAELAHGIKKQWLLKVERLLREQRFSPDLWMVFAPIKHTRMDAMIEKATELGVNKLVPVLTQHTIVRSINDGRMRSVSMEAAEQSGRMDVPQVEPLQQLTQLLGSWPSGRTLIFGDESGGSPPANQVLSQLQPGSYGVLVGPEGGFTRAELDLLQRLPFAHGMSMGPRIMRADTAAVAALTCVQSWLGDWEKRPAFQAEA